MFSLHPTLKKDLVEICDLKLCKLMLLPDTENPWAVLIPRLEDIREVHELSRQDQIQLMDEINEVSLFFDKNFGPEKINIGALGNMVAQLHVHIIARYSSDRAWPGAIWGTKSKKESFKIKELEVKLKEAFSRN
ncbi:MULTISPECIES: HIT domain-containing protein [unclassified Halobacteriovorax]|uniref:HIT domain-containing protein n=1 Tax=unclassified Halobacteriovorax TaxID=2639665 RepID=UPI000EA365D5|nr:HIT family protein [Halobacteriovorax sp. BALOs_7]AYF44052.1 scavenger mRNA decapping enzyme [Halobacteriovorax sp. BALOs_7]